MELAARGVEGEKGSGCNGQVSEIKTHSRLPNRAYSVLQGVGSQKEEILHMLALLLLQAGQCWRQMTDWLRRIPTQYDCSSMETHLC